MHPNKTFHWEDADAMRAFVARQGFAHVFAPTLQGPMVAHLPLTPKGDDWRFHLARNNRLAPHLDGAAVIASVVGPQAYISPDWYADATDQVPTWNYVAVEIEGVAHQLVEADLVAQIDALAQAHEAPLAPKPAWTRDKVAPGKIAAMISAITCFEIRVTAMRGTRKLSQNKRPEDRERIAAALGAHPLAALLDDQS